MILVTGGAGFIGSCLLAGLEARGRTDLVVCDRLRDGDKWRNIAKRGLADLIAPERLAEFLDRHGAEIETIVHMGAISSTTVRDADLIIETNFRLSLFLWDWCAENDVRLIYASSAATYGDGGQGFVDDDSRAHLAKLRPLNAYGFSKNLFDRLIAQRLVDKKPAPPQWVGLKFFNVYGPNEYHKGGQKSVVAHLFPRAIEGEPAVLFASHHPDYEDGGQLRDFVWVGDCVDVMLWFMDNPQVCGLFNCGSGKARSFKDLATALYSALGREVAIKYVPTPEDIRDKYQYFTEADLSRLRSVGYEAPFTSLEDGVRRYVSDYLNSDDPYM